MDLQIGLFFLAVLLLILYLRRKNTKAYNQQIVYAKIDPTVIIATENEVVYEAHTIAPVVESQNTLTLVGIGTEYYGNRIPLTHTVILGRDPAQAQLVFQSNEVSRSHLKITLSPPFLQLEDLGSSNGSQVCLPNGNFQPLRSLQIPINQARGTVIQLGSGKIKFSIA
jgi:FHA domain